MTDADFYNNLQGWIEEDIEDWNRVTLVAYFCYKYQYKNKNNPDQVQFRLTKSKRGSVSSKELADLSKLFNTFAPENYSELPWEHKRKVTGMINLKIRNYINWVFDWKFRSGNKTVNSTRIFLSPALIVEFERMYAKYLEKQNNLSKIDQLIAWCQKEVPDLFKKHQLNKVDDLLLIKRYADQYKLEQNSLERRVLNQAMLIGLISEKK